MADIFLKLLNTSITAAWVVLAVMLLRLVLKKAPKWIDCVLWGIVGLRLIMPFSIESIFSLIPSSQTVPEDIVFSPKPTIDSGIDSVDALINPVITETLAPQGLVSINPVQILLLVGSVIWAAGMAAMVLYCIISYIRLYRRVRVSVQQRDNVYICDQIETPFILGVVAPRIYIPSGLPQEQAEHVIAHEKAHLKRGDHWWKPLGFALLTVYWFNPVLWVAYRLLSRDIELACDEKVIKTMQNSEKKAYAEALAFCGNHRKMIVACPLAFGEVGVKERIKSVLRYNKPAFWVIAVAVVVCAVVAVCFLTDPKPCQHEYHSQITAPATCTQEGTQTFTCSNCEDSYTVPVSMLAHTYDDGIIAVEPTCAQLGRKVFTCAGCGKEKTEELDMVAHTAGMPTFTKEANCTQQGEESATCSVCAEVFVVNILETNDVHDLKNTVIRAATCADPGEGVNTCMRCDYSESCTYELLAHDYKKGMSLPATCANEGQQQHVCDTCGAEKWTTTPKSTEHVWRDGGLYWPDFCAVCGITNHDDKPELSNPRSVLDGTTYDSTDSELYPIISIWP